ncbi:MAG: helix-turn-helix transcriptional regulator [Planctomycetes bacterium]|nr:helix-turn-helix transcriptional regulator [Planctomycetota bacterium]
MDDSTQKRLAKKFKALSNPNRFRLFEEILSSQEANYEEKGHACFLQGIMQTLKIAAPTVSHHLKELVNAGLITTELEGKLLTCRVNPEAVAELEAFFARAQALRV